MASHSDVVMLTNKYLAHLNTSIGLFFHVKSKQILGEKTLQKEMLNQIYRYRIFMLVLKQAQGILPHFFQHYLYL